MRLQLRVPDIENRQDRSILNEKLELVRFRLGLFGEINIKHAKSYSLIISITNFQLKDELSTTLVHK